ncbi:hypothetical protein CENTIMANUS_00093 [Klebsiella phage vB_KpM_Centimanus]
MANKFDNIQKQSQALSDAADAITEANTSGSNDNTPVSTTVASDSAVGGSASVSTVSTASQKSAVDAYAGQSDTVKLIVAHLETYVLNMAPEKVQTDTSLKENQTILYRTLEQLVNLSDVNDFAICMKRLFALVRKYEDAAFAPNMRFRRLSLLAKGDKQLDKYINFVDMICAFAVPAVRKSIIQRYNLVRAAEFAKPEYRERLIEFVRAISG